MKKIRRILEAKWLVMLVWLAGVAVVWEVFAFRVEAVKRTPENIMPHIWQIVQAIFSTDTVTRDQTALQVVLTSAGQTLERAALGFLIGTILGFVLALLMHLFRGVEKTVSPYLIIIQVIPILGMAPIVLAITGDIGVSRIVIAAILTFYPVAANTLSGFLATEREKKELMYSYAANKFQLYTKTYIPKDQKPYASQLAIRRYLLEKQKEYQTNLDALAYYFRHDSYNSGKAEQLLTYDSAYHSLLAEHFQPVSQELQTWESSPYNKNKNYPEQLKHKTCKNEFMRSKSEAMIAMSLYVQKIPYRYECELKLGSITLFPDFTIRHPETGEIFYWEHFGMMDKPCLLYTSPSPRDCS